MFEKHWSFFHTSEIMQNISNKLLLKNIFFNDAKTKYKI
jgi:hypothetical protein